MNRIEEAWKMQRLIERGEPQPTCLQTHFHDSLVYGFSAIKPSYRKWYNPMRWIKGKVYLKVISQQDFYKN